VGLERYAPHAADAVAEHGQGTPSGDARIKLAQRTSGSIARIGKGGLSLLLTTRIEALEVTFGHIDLPAHFQTLGQRSVGDGDQPQGDGLDGPEILCDILAAHPVATRRPLHE
jgi:hypothetical protein